MKRCSHCKTIKPVSEFHRNARKPDGLNDQCKPCRSEQEKARRARHGVAINHRTRTRYATADPRERRIRRRMQMYNLTRQQSEHVEDQSACEWCGRLFGPGRGPDAKTVHHDHVTGAYIATLCGRCNSIEGWIVQVATLAGLTIDAYLAILREGITRGGHA